MSAPLDLLRLLAGAGAARVRPGGAPQAPTIEGLNFSALLKKAQAGEIATGREVTVGKDAGVALDPSQLARLAGAADRAEAQGAARALVLIDGMALRLDVTTREITGAADLGAGGAVTNVDAVVSVPSDASALPGPDTALPGLLPLPKAGALSNPSLLKLLSGVLGG